MNNTIRADTRDQANFRTDGAGLLADRLVPDGARPSLSPPKATQGALERVPPSHLSPLPSTLSPLTSHL